MKNNLMKDNRGLTLTELVVTIAIIAIFSGVVLSLVGNGANSYRSTSGNAKVQMETQETLDRIQDLVIDANRSLYYAYGTSSSMSGEILNDINKAAGSSKTFLVCNEYEQADGATSKYVYDVLDWDSAEKKLYYSQRQFTGTSTKAK